MSSFIQAYGTFGGNWIVACVAVLIALTLLLESTRNIGPTQVGLVRKRFAIKKLGAGSAIALSPELHEHTGPAGS